MGNASSSEGASGSLGLPNLLSKVSVSGTSKADVDAFLSEGRIDNVNIAYNTKKQHERFNPRNVNRRVVLTHSTLKIVKRNWTMISETPEAQSPLSSAVTPLVILYDTFFGQLFMLEPSMRALFEENMIRQSKFLVGLVNIMVGMEGMLKQGLAPVYSFADRSVSMGVRPEHYEVIAEVLPIALELVLVGVFVAVATPNAGGGGGGVTQWWRRVQSCAGTDGWTKLVAEAWWNVMSFAILVVVERTVESWGSSHGMSLSEMWHSLYEWRTHAKHFSPMQLGGVDHSGGSRVPDNVRRMSTMSTVTSSMGSNESAGASERGPKLDSLVAPARSPSLVEHFRGKDLSKDLKGNATIVDGSTSEFSSNEAVTDVANAAGDEILVSPPILTCATKAKACVDGSGDMEIDGAREPSRSAWAPMDDGGIGAEVLSVERIADIPEDAISKRILNSCTASHSAELDGPNGAYYLSDEPDGSSNSPSVAGSGPVGGSKTQSNGSGALTLAMPTDGGTRDACLETGIPTSPLEPMHRRKTDSFHLSTAPGPMVETSIAGILPLGRDVPAGTVNLMDASISPERPLSTDGALNARALGLRGRERRSLGDLKRQARTRTGAASVPIGGGASASGSGVSVSSGSGNGIHGKTFGSMVLNRGTFGRRKKITRSASLEDDEELNQRRQRASSVGRRHEMGSAGTMRGRGREGVTATLAGYVRSQSVTDEVLTQRRSGSGAGFVASADLDMAERLTMDPRTRRRGIVSRMRRMGSNVMRFRSGSRQHHVAHGGSAGVANSLLNYNSNGSIGNGCVSSIGTVGERNSVDSHRNGYSDCRGAVLASSAQTSSALVADGGASVGVQRLRVSSVSPATAVPTPVSATPATGMTATPPDSQGRRANGRGVGVGVGSSGGSGRGRKPASRAHSTGELETERDRKALKAKAGRAAEEIRRRAMLGPDGGMEGQGAGVKNAWNNGEGEARNGVNGRSSRTGSSGLNGRLRPVDAGKLNEQGAPVNPWRQMKLYELMATLEDKPGEETEKNFAPISEAILYHMGPSEAPTTRAVALDVAQTFVQRVLSSRSKDKRSSKVRRKAFKELLSRLIPLMLDCLKRPTCVGLPGVPIAAPIAAPGSRDPIPTGGGGDESLLKQRATLPKVNGSALPSGLDAAAGGLSEGGDEGCKGGKALGGEVVVLHYYQQHHQYVLKVAVLETLNRFLMVLRALFRPPHSTSVQKAVAPLLDAEEDVLREKAAAVLGKLSLCGKDNTKWVNIAIKVSLEAQNLLHDAWPDDGVGQIPSKQVESIMGEHPLLPPVQDTFRPGDAEAHVRAVGRRFPALCKLLATLITASPPPKSHESDGQVEDMSGHQEDGGKPATCSAGQQPLLVSLTISLVQRVLRMGQQAWDFVEKEEVTKEREEARGDKDSKGCYLTKLKGTLSPELASRVTGLLLPAAVTLLEALVDSSKLEDAMKDQQEAVCLCMGQAIAQMPVQGGVRCAAYRAMAVILRDLEPQLAAESLGVPVLPLLLNEALLALGNRMNLQPLNTKRDPLPPSKTPGGSSAPPLCFNMRTPANNGHGPKINEDAVCAGVECLAVLIWDCGLHLPASKMAQVERVVSEGVELLAHRPLEVSPFDQDEPQVLRHPATREAFVRLAHYYLLLAEGKGQNTSTTLFSEAMLAFQFHLQDPDEAVTRECRSALTALKGGNVDEARDIKRLDQAQALEDMEAEADNDLHPSTGESGWELEEGENGEFHVVRKVDRTGLRSPSPLLAGSAGLGV